MNRNAAATIIALGVTALAAALSWPAYRFAQAARPAAPAQPTAPVTATLTIAATMTPIVTQTVTPTLTPVATDTATPTLTPTATASPSWVYLHTDTSMRIQICDGLAPAIGTTPPPLIGCSDVGPWTDTPAQSAPGQLYLWPGPWRYRAYVDATPTPRPGWCEPVYIVVTPTPMATDTPTATPTADWVATAVVATLTALAPTATGTPRPTETAEPTPTAAVWRATLPLVRQWRSRTWR